MSETRLDRISGRDLRVTRDLDAPRDLVWKAITDPAHVDLWWGPDGFQNITAKNDLRPGGSWVFVMRGPDGTEYPNAITYREIDPPNRFTYRQGTTEVENPEEEFESVITLEEVGGKTRLTMTMAFKHEDALDRMMRDYGAAEGAIQHVENLVKHLAGMT